MHHYLIAVRVRPGTIQAFKVWADTAGEACDIAEDICRTGPVVSCRRIFN